MESIGTKGGADSVKERAMRGLTATLQSELSKVFSSCILTEMYPATTIAFQLTVIELDSDLLQSMINCASLTLYKSTIQCRCLPIAITMFLKPADKRHQLPPKEWIQIDPNYAQIKHAQQYTHRSTMVWNVDVQELVSFSLQPLCKSQPLDLKEIDEITGVSLSIAQKLHEFILEL